MAQAARSTDFERTGSLTKQRILAAAQELFASNGYTGTTVRAIASRLDLTDPAIYYHFRSKRQIFDALLQGPRVSHQLALDDAAASREELVECMFTTVTAYTRQPDMLRMLFRQQFGGDPASNLRRRESTARFQAMLAAPFAALYGERGPAILEALGIVTSGILWDAIVTHGARFTDVVAQPSFARRVRNLMELAMPPVTR